MVLYIMLHTILYDTLHDKIQKEISYLPKDIHGNIIQYIPYHTKYCLNKTYFHIFHKSITFSPYEGYVRNIIYTNSTFVLKELLLSNCNKWKEKNKYLYKKVRCDTFISLLNTWSIEYRSNDCKNLLDEFIGS